jgi:hypothetical protein
MPVKASGIALNNDLCDRAQDVHLVRAKELPSHKEALSIEQLDLPLLKLKERHGSIGAPRAAVDRRVKDSDLSPVVFIPLDES